MSARDGRMRHNFETTDLARKGLAVALALWLLTAAALADGGAGDGFYELGAIPQVGEGEEAVLLLERSYYSGDPVYKGKTDLPLNGACALHCGAVLISNLRGEMVTCQQVAQANNRDIRDDKRWTPFVSWGKVASAFGISLHTENIAQYGDYLRNHGIKKDDRRGMKMSHLVELFRDSGQNGGMMIHFNSSGRLNGSGTHRHAVVLVGYIQRDGQITDLLINDSSIPAPQGACVRMSASSLPASIIGEKQVDRLRSKGEDIAMILMDYAVSCRWAEMDEP